MRLMLWYMGDREQAGISDFVEAVWGKDYAEIGDNAIHAAISRVNHVLNKHKYPRLLTKARGEPIVRWA
jgi:hypothetical protein